MLRDFAPRARALLMACAATLAAGCNEDQVNFTADTAPQLQLVAGALGGPAFVDGLPAAARLYYPRRVAFDGSGRLIVNDNCVYRRTNSDGTMTTYAGSSPVGRCTAPLPSPETTSSEQLVAQPDGTAYFTQYNGSQVYQLDTTGATTLYWDGGAGAVVSGLARASNGDLLVYRSITSSSSCHVLRLAPAGSGLPPTATVVGGGATCGRTDGPAGTATLPKTARMHLAVDSAGNILMVDTAASSLRQLAIDGSVATRVPLVGAGTGQLFGLAVDAHDNVFVGVLGAGAGLGTNRGPGGAVYEIAAGTATVTTLAGQEDVSGTQDGSGSVATFEQPSDVAVDASGNVWVTDETAGTLREISPSGVVSTPWGAPEHFGDVDARGSAARFDTPGSLVTAPDGGIFVGDTGNCAIRHIDTSGYVTHFAGQPGQCTAQDGSASSATIGSLGAMTMSADGGLTFGDGCTVRHAAPDGSITTLAGQSALCVDIDGKGSAAAFGMVTGLAYDAAGNLWIGGGPNGGVSPVYLTDCGQGGAVTFQQCSIGGLLRRMAPDGTVTTVAGHSGPTTDADGTGTAAVFADVEGVIVDADGNVIVADGAGATIRAVTPAGVVTTLAGTATPGEADGTGAAAGFGYPLALAADVDGTLIVYDTGDYLAAPRLRRITTSGTVTTVMVSAGYPAVGVQLGATPRLGLYFGGGLAVQSDGGVLLTFENAVLRFGVPQ